MTVADAIVGQLAAWGVTEVYGVAGSSLLPLLDALARQDRIRYVGVRHEESAAFMASAQAKLTGRLGVCLAHAGPGAAHLVNGLYDAHMDGAPVLALTGQVPTRKIGTDAKQSADQSLMFAGCAGLSRQVDSAEAVGELLAAAMRYAVAMDDVAHLALPSDLLGETLAVAAPRRVEPFLTTPPQPDAEAIDAAVEALRGARQPAILMGRGARGDARAVLDLAGRLGAPVLTSLFAKGALGEDHPLVAGVVGDAGSDWAAEVARRADAFLVLGCTWWPKSYMPGGLPVIQVDQRPTAIGAGNPLQVGIAARVADVLPRLDRGLPERRRPWIAKPDGQESFPDDLPLHPGRTLRALRSVLPPDAVVCVDTGLHTLWYGRSFPARAETTLVSGRWRSLGFALPAAIAASICQPDRPVVAITGDGGLGMVMHELLTAVRYRLPITVLVMRDGLLGEEAAKMRQAGFDPFGMELENPDFAAFARICGGDGIRIERADDLAPAFKKALGSRGPVVVDVPTRHVPVPALASEPAPAARR